MTLRSRGVDVALAVLLAAAAAAAAIALFNLAGGLIPRHNVYFGADTDRVVANLIDRSSNYSRLSVHPLYGLVGVAFRLLVRPTADLATALRWCAAGSGALFAVLVFAAIRVWGGGRSIAAAAVVLGMSMASFVYWVAVAETHFLAGLTVLVIIILSRWLPASPYLRLVQSAVAFALGFSVVVTDVMAWFFAEMRLLDLPVRRLPRRLGEIVAVAPRVAAAALAGLGLVTIAYSIQAVVLANPTVSQLLHVIGESKYVSVAKGSAVAQFAALGVAENLGLAVAGGVVLAALLVVALFRLRRDAVFIAVFPLFGLALHSFYDRKHSLLFAPNYAPAAVVALALLAARWKPRAAAAAMVVVAAGLGWANVTSFVATQQRIRPQTDPAGFYAPLRRPHPVSAQISVRNADPPIGPDE